MNFDGTGLKSLVSTGDGARGVAVDFAKSTIYWSHVNRHAISKANLDGTHSKDVVTTGLNFPFDVDIDIESKKIYWSDSSQNQIGRANLNGTDQTVVIPFPCASSVGNFCTAGGELAIDFGDSPRRSGCKPGGEEVVLDDRILFRHHVFNAPRRYHDV